MSKLNVKHLVIPTVALTVICLIVTGLLSVTNYFTKERIAAAKANNVSVAMQELVPGAEFEDLMINGESEISYKAAINGNPSGYVFITNELGYKSKIKVMTALDTDGTVTGVKIIDCAEESPGIGQKVGTDSAFTAQFTGQNGSASADAITGATFSSKAVTRAVNEALNMFSEISGGESVGE